MKLNELEDFPELGNTIVIDGIEYVKKQEPLSDEEIYSIGNKYAFHAAVREIERMHGIGGGE